MKKLILQETANLLTVKKRNNPSKTVPGREARIVRRYLKDHVALADLAEESGTSPAQISQWVNAALESLEEAFSGEPWKAARKHRKDLSKKDERIPATGRSGLGPLHGSPSVKKILGPPWETPMVRRK